MYRLLPIAALAAACVSGALAGAFADEQAPRPSPIQIDACSLQYVPGNGFLGALGKSTGLLRIKFTNEGDKQVDVIRFAVDVDGKTASIRDVGKFAPGITITHDFKDFAGKEQFIISRQAQPTCRVTFVKYADGASWGSAVDTPAPSASPTSTP